MSTYTNPIKEVGLIQTDPATGKTLADIEQATQLEALVQQSGQSIADAHLHQSMNIDGVPAAPEPSWRAIARQTSPETLAMMQHAIRMQPALVASPMGLARLFPGLRK